MEQRLKHMQDVYYFRDLRIVGYAEVPSASPYMPRPLTPIFQLADSNDTRLMLPPYALYNDRISDPVIWPTEAYDDAVCAGELTSLGVRAMRAQYEHELWIDDVGEVHYTPRREMKIRLKAISKIYRIKATVALALNDNVEAQKCAVVSFSARQNLKALYLRLEAEQRMGRHAEIQFTQSLITQEIVRKTVRPDPGIPSKQTYCKQ